MGEYAAQGKMGTCEDFYYLRFDQRHRVTPDGNSADPVRYVDKIRFRFPWPDEDHIPPCGEEFSKNGYQRAIAAHGFQSGPDVEHGSVQFVAHAGYVTSLPCPESGRYTGPSGVGARRLTGSPDDSPINVHRNGFPGAVQLVAQKYRPGIGLVPVLRCGGCGEMWRLEDRGEIEALAVAFRFEGDRRAKDGGADFFHAIADRILAGLDVRIGGVE
jgi:hypothetical protein